MATRKETSISTGGSFSGIGFITWLVFLILKLCNQNNPNFAWLTWFWVWFPFWIGICIDLVLSLLIGVITFIIVTKSDSD